MAWKVLLNEPIHDSFTPSLAVTVTRESKIKHQKYFNSRVVKIAVVRRTPQCITQKKEAMKSNFSLPVMSLLIFFIHEPLYYKSPSVRTGILCASLFVVPLSGVRLSSIQVMKWRFCPCHVNISSTTFITPICSISYLKSI